MASKQDKVLEKTVDLLTKVAGPAAIHVVRTQTVDFCREREKDLDDLSLDEVLELVELCVNQSVFDPEKKKILKKRLQNAARKKMSPLEEPIEVSELVEKAPINLDAVPSEDAQRKIIDRMERLLKKEGGIIAKSTAETRMKELLKEKEKKLGELTSRELLEIIYLCIEGALPKRTYGTNKQDEVRKKLREYLQFLISKYH